MRDKVTRQCPPTTTFEVKGEPKQIRTEVQPLLTSLTDRPNWLPWGYTSGGAGLCTLYFARLPGESYRRRLRSVLCLCDVFRALITPLFVESCVLFVCLFVCLTRRGGLGWGLR